MRLASLNAPAGATDVVSGSFEPLKQKHRARTAAAAAAAAFALPHRRSLLFRSTSTSKTTSTRATSTTTTWTSPSLLAVEDMLSAGKAHDPELVAHEDHLRYRTEQFARTLRALEESEGSLEAFADGAKKFGLVREPGKAETTFREWAPAAVEALLLADFNDWKGTPLQRDRYGVWSAVLPDLIEGGDSGTRRRPAIAMRPS